MRYYIRIYTRNVTSLLNWGYSNRIEYPCVQPLVKRFGRYSQCFFSPKMTSLPMPVSVLYMYRGQK
jgi:hypothetical protein